MHRLCVLIVAAVLLARAAAYSEVYVSSLEIGFKHADSRKATVVEFWLSMDRVAGEDSGASHHDVAELMLLMTTGLASVSALVYRCTPGNDTWPLQAREQTLTLHHALFHACGIEESGNVVDVSFRDLATFRNFVRKQICEKGDGTFHFLSTALNRVGNFTQKGPCNLRLTQLMGLGAVRIDSVEGWIWTAFELDPTWLRISRAYRHLLEEERETDAPAQQPIHEEIGRVPKHVHMLDE